MENRLLPDKYAIPINPFSRIFQQEVWKWRMNFNRTFYNENLSTDGFMEGMSIEHHSVLVQKEFFGKRKKLNDVYHESFLPYLINYLVICDFIIGMELLNHLYDEYDNSFKRKIVDFFKVYLQSTFNDYNGIIDDSASKYEQYKDWLETKISNSGKKPPINIELFNISFTQIETILTELMRLGILNTKGVNSMRHLLENKPVNDIKLKATRIQITDFFRRLLFCENNKCYTKLQAAQQLSKAISYYKKETKTYKKLEVKAFKDDFSNNLAFPKNQSHRILLKDFPENV